MYCIYYLPYAKRTYRNSHLDLEVNIKGKVGCTNDYHRRIIYEKSWTEKFGQLDITGHRILMRNIPTEKEALRIEKILQKTYHCVEPITGWATKGSKIKDRGPEWRENVSAAKLGNTYRKGKIGIRITCELCNYSASPSMFNRRHPAYCKRHKNQST